MNNESMTRLETFVNLGFKRDPFKGVAFETGDGLRVRRILTMAVESRAMVSICGERGLGKSVAIGAALEKLAVKQVTVNRAQKEKISIADIESALVYDLSDESPKRSSETRSRQVRRIVGEASRKQKIVVVIEEAHRMHSSTLRSLKTLREIHWLGESELFTVVLVGQSDPMARAGVSEVRLRSDCVRMQGLSGDEAAGYLRAVLGKWFDESALTALPELPQARNWLELQEAAVVLLNRALAAGREQVTGEDVRALIGALQQSLRVPGGKKVATVAPVSGNATLAAVLAGKSAVPVAVPTAIGER
jgi:type II secretory pathway predicted ATPase ExeA